MDIVDITGGSLYGMLGARPHWAVGKDRRAAITNVPAGFYFNPSAFLAAVVPPGSVIPGAHDPGAYSSTGGTEFGNIGRNIIRGPAQNDIDFSISKHFSITEAKDLRFQADFFNLLNHPNRDAPNNDINDPDFGKAMGFSSSPRILQLSVKLSF